jgi:hypothetical protein
VSIQSEICGNRNALHSFGQVSAAFCWCTVSMMGHVDVLWMGLLIRTALRSSRRCQAMFASFVIAKSSDDIISSIAPRITSISGNHSYGVLQSLCAIQSSVTRIVATTTSPMSPCISTQHPIRSRETRQSTEGWEGSEILKNLNCTGYKGC